MSKAKPRTTAQPAVEPWAAWMVGATAVVAAIVLWASGPFLRAFRLRGDDFPLVLNSAARYIDLGAVLKWFTEGYTNYFWNYPGWPSRGFAFSRPVMNAAIWCESVFAPAIGDRAYLLLNYVAVIAVVPLLMVALRQNSNVRPWLAAVVAFAVALSPAWYDALFFPSFGTNTFAAVFALAAIVVLDPRRGDLERRRQVWIAVLLSLAVLSHETAAVAPIALFALYIALSPKPVTWRDAWPFVVPLVVMIVLRLINGLGASNYVSAAGGAGEVWLRLKEFVVGPLFPFNSVGFKIQARPLPIGAAVPFYLGVIANAAAVVALARGLIDRPRRKVVALLAAVGISLVPGLWMYGDPRFMGFSLVLALIVLCYLTVPFARYRYAFIVLLLLANAALFTIGFAGDVGRRSAVAQAGGAFFDTVSEGIRTTRPSAVLLVNDQVGGNGALAMLRMAAWPRTDAELVVINGMAGPPMPGSTTTVGVVGGATSVATTLTAPQRLTFEGCVPDFDVPTSGFTYTDVVEPEVGGGSFRASRDGLKGPVLVVGIDPATGQAIVRPVTE